MQIATTPIDRGVLDRPTTTAPKQPTGVQIGALLGLMTVLALPFVLTQAFGRISWFDDEGTLLIGIRAFVQGHRMYDEIFSLYGPAYNLFYGLVYGPLGAPQTHDFGRVIAVTLWLTWTAGFALFCFQLSRSIMSTVFCFVALVVWLPTLMDSVGHPEELCLVLISAILLMTDQLERTGKGEEARLASLFGLGGAVAALALIKINLGVLVGAPLLVVLLRQSSAAFVANVIAPLAAIVLILLPAPLQAPLFDLPWVKAYCAFCIPSIAATCLVFFSRRSSPFMSFREWMAVVAGGGLTALLIVGAMALAGSSLFGILNGVVLQNVHFIRNWYIPIFVGRAGVLAAVASLVLAGAWRLSLAAPGLSRYREQATTAIQFVFVAVGLLLFVRDDSVAMFRFLLPFCWLLLARPESNACRAARPAAALIAVAMALYSYPVAGHQVSISTALPLVIVAVVACDVGAALCASWPSWTAPLQPWSRIAAGAFALSVGAAATFHSVRTYWRNTDLGLPGTAFIRVDRQFAEDLRWVTDNLSGCRSSYSVPGLFSFNLWTGQAPPTVLNVNAQLNVLDAQQQQAVVDSLSRQDGLCVVYNRSFLERFDRGQMASNPPLLKYVSTDLAPVSERDGYVILRPRPHGS
jgi:hypothetical protein